MLFIATTDPIAEIPFDSHNPTFYIEKLIDDYKDVADKFINSNIYFIGTGRGCSCDFGIEQNTVCEEELINQNRNLETGFFDTIRKIFGIQKKYILNKIAKQSKLIEKHKNYLNQTEMLFEIIEEQTSKDKNVELFYCWAGEYSQEIEDTKIINLDSTNLVKVFDTFLEKDKIIFTRGSR